MPRKPIRSNGSSITRPLPLPFQLWARPQFLQAQMSRPPIALAALERPGLLGAGVALLADLHAVGHLEIIVKPSFRRLGVACHPWSGSR